MTAQVCEQVTGWGDKLSQVIRAANSVYKQPETRTARTSPNTALVRKTTSSRNNQLMCLTSADMRKNQHMTGKLSLLGPNNSLCNWILSILTKRPGALINHIIKFIDAYREEMKRQQTNTKSSTCLWTWTKQKRSLLTSGDNKATALHLTSTDSMWRSRALNSLVCKWQRTSPGP